MPELELISEKKMLGVTGDRRLREADVGEVVITVPGIQSELLIEGHHSPLGMPEGAREVLGRERPEQQVKAGVGGFKQVE